MRFGQIDILEFHSHMVSVLGAHLQTMELEARFEQYEAQIAKFEALLEQLDD